MVRCDNPATLPSSLRVGVIRLSLEPGGGSFHWNISTAPNLDGTELLFVDKLINLGPPQARPSLEFVDRDESGGVGQCHDVVLFVVGPLYRVERWRHTHRSAMFAGRRKKFTGNQIKFILLLKLQTDPVINPQIFLLFLDKRER